MKLSEILTEARKGAFIFKVAVNDASKVFANSKGELGFATTLFQKKYANREDGDEIVKAANKETNVSELKRVIKRYSNIEMTIRLGSIDYSGIIDIDEIEELKKELGISNKEIAEFFGLTPMTYANSSAKKRYENALCKFYELIKSKAE